MEKNSAGPDEFDMEWLIIIRWIIGGFLLAFGAFISIGNWITLIKTVIKKGSTSFIPILGGTFAFIGLAIIPVQDRFIWLWVPFVADWGCIPMWTLIGFSTLTGRMKWNEDAGNQEAGHSDQYKNDNLE